MPTTESGTDILDRPLLLQVLSDVESGNFSARMPLDSTGFAGKVAERLNNVIAANQMMGSELARVSQAVGREGRLSNRMTVGKSGQAWSECVQAVNSMIDDLVQPTSEMQRVIGAVADGDLSQKISADFQGEMLKLKTTINAMVDQLNRFAGEVSRVAREVGVEGRLGGQAQSNEVAGVWKNLTDNVNQLAANLTNQVRAIADVATAVTEGDLTRQVGVEASGEVAVLREKLNEMIRNLRETTRQNTEQDWLKTNLERFTRMLQGQRDLSTASTMILSELAALLSAQHGVFYTMATLGDEPVLQFQAGYGYQERKHLANHFRIGEGLVGQCAREKQRILLTDVPGDYVKVNSGLGESPPLNIIVMPVLFEGVVRGVVELASLGRFSPTHQAFLDQLAESIGLVLNTIEANTLTENLLKQSQFQAEELKAQQEELRRSNEYLGQQAGLLAGQNTEVERKNLEVEEAKRLVEEKADQLAVSSRYKSEFLANMSHELRTPLNSLLILAEQLEDNPEKNLTAEQVSYAAIIRSSGRDLLGLINDILDLAKVESGTVHLEVADLSLVELREGMLRDYTHVAEAKGITYSVALERALPLSISTDSQRVRQVLKNLLSNAFKFTEKGSVALHVGIAEAGWTPGHTSLDGAPAVIAFAVTDTGIGIANDKVGAIFEAFAQAHGGTARRYGGTGLGLSISRELARVLGGEITLSSAVDQGSTFTLYLPSEGGCTATEPPIGVISDGNVRQQPPVDVGTVADHTNGHAPARGRPEGSTLRTGSPIAEATTRLAGMKVLVVDDDFRNVFALTALLERCHFKVESAGSGQDAIETLERLPDVDMVLMDIMMPVMDGYDTIRALRSDPRLALLPIIAVTAAVMPAERARCMEAGATAYVPKPVDTRELLEVLSKCLPGRPASSF